METHIIEATQSAERGPNHGKFLVMRYGADERNWWSTIDPGRTVLEVTGDGGDLIWVLDLQTREGAAFRPGGYPWADLQKHALWVCPMFEPFLEWLYEQDFNQPLFKLPRVVELPEAPPSMQGYRRPGPDAYEDLIGALFSHANLRGAHDFLSDEQKQLLGSVVATWLEKQRQADRLPPLDADIDLREEQA